jgi:hypothetical protein
MKLYMKIEEGDEILETDHSGTFLTKVKGHCFISIDCCLKDYQPGTKIKADYIGKLNQEPKNLPWRKYYPNKTSQ